MMQWSFGMDDLMIDVKDLSRSFKDVKAVDDITFQVQRGEIFGLLGPNGAGKTTTIRMLTGQITPNSGSARVAGCDVVSDHERLKGLIGVVFEDQNLYERLSARENLRFSCWLYGLTESRIDELLDLVHLIDKADKSVRTFSTGMKQRLMVARSLLHKPPVLFLDEPTRGLDPISARDVREIITNLSREGTTILLTTHLLEEADQLCQHLAFIVGGKLVATGTPFELKLAHGQRSLQVMVSDPKDRQKLEEVTLGMDNARDQARLVELLKQGHVRAVHSREATLEEVFIEVAGIRPA
jgi:ABC-2 type transport system ATP-binding protein